jgi:hypothetical protein
VRFVAVTGLLGLCLSLPACADDPEWALPDRDDPAVQAEEARLADVVEQSPVVWAPMSCGVRLLGHEDGAAFVWARCEGVHPDGHDIGTSLPLRIDRDEVTEPGTGSEYDDGVQEMFPPALADLVLADPDSLRP